MAHFTHMQDYTLTELFKKMDSDGSGTIDANELRQVLVSEGVELSAADAAGLLTKLDSLDGQDVELDLEEFKLIMTGSAAEMGAVVERFAATLQVMQAERKAPADIHPATNGWGVVGRPWVAGRLDGPARHATLTSPQGLCYDEEEAALFIADRHSLRRIELGRSERLVEPNTGGQRGGELATLSGDEFFGTEDGRAPPSASCGSPIDQPAGVCACPGGGPGPPPTNHPRRPAPQSRRWHGSTSPAA
eukprot:SAG11_NODE_36_length_21869_cov_38.038999_3_plen_247_part_00